jgi:ribosome-associated translation inhibitor RaiA
MELSIRSRGIDLSDELRDLVARRMQFALDTFEDRVDLTSVYLADLNGPKGGVDKLCQITLRTQGAGEIAVRDTGPSVETALNRAASRVKYRLAEALRQANRPSSTESIRKASEAA